MSGSDRVLGHLSVSIIDAYGKTKVRRLFAAQLNDLTLASDLSHTEIDYVSLCAFLPTI